MVLDIKANTAIGSTNLSTVQKKTKKNDAVGTSGYNPVIDYSQENDTTGVMQTQGLNTISVEHLITLTTTLQDRSSKAIAYGHEMLSHLENMRDDILKGQLSKETLTKIQIHLNDTSLASLDTKLTNILEDIRIRAEVELAKWDTQKKE